MTKLLPKQPGADRVNKGRTWDDYKALAFEAQVLYVKHGLSAYQVAGKLGISIQTVSKWNKAGRWNELRPDLEIMNQYKASAMYLQQGLTTGEIAQKLNVSESDIKIWATMFGWNATRHILQARDVAAEALAPFCAILAELLPREAAAIEVAKDSYLKGLKPILQPHELNH